MGARLRVTPVDDEFVDTSDDEWATGEDDEFLSGGPDEMSAKGGKAYRTTASWESKSSWTEFSADSLVAWTDSLTESMDHGLVLESVDTAGQLFLIFEALPTQAAEITDESDLPEWALAYVEAAVLEKVFGSDTDTYVPSLRDYWAQRKEVGLQVLRRHKQMKSADRTYQLGGKKLRKTWKGPRLPPEYPAI